MAAWSICRYPIMRELCVGALWGVSLSHWLIDSQAIPICIWWDTGICPFGQGKERVENMRHWLQVSFVVTWVIYSPTSWLDRPSPILPISRNELRRARTSLLAALTTLSYSTCNTSLILSSCRRLWLWISGYDEHITHQLSITWWHLNLIYFKIAIGLRFGSQIIDGSWHRVKIFIERPTSLLFGLISVFNIDQALMSLIEICPIWCCAI